MAAQRLDVNCVGLHGIISGHANYRKWIIWGRHRFARPIQFTPKDQMLRLAFSLTDLVTDFGMRVSLKSIPILLRFIMRVTNIFALEKIG